MAIAFTEWDQVNGTITAGIKQRVLASSDWSHLQLAGAPSTTLASSVSAGATSASVSSSLTTPITAVFGTGTAPDVRRLTSISGTGPYTVSWSAAEPLANGYASGTTINTGTMCKATTTRGAQMVVDITAFSTQFLQTTVWASHDGTTGVGSLTRYVPFKQNAGAATDVEHCRVSAGKEHVWIEIEGPRAGEAGTDSTSGSFRGFLFVGDLVPYDAADTTPAVACIGGASGTTSDQNTTIRVSKSRDGSRSWVVAHCLTVGYPQYNYAATQGNGTPQMRSGDYVAWPFVVSEYDDGLRGRIGNFHYAGLNAAQSSNDGNDVQATPQGTEMVYGSYRYRAFNAFKTQGGGNNVLSYGIARVDNGSNYWFTPVTWVPVAAAP